MTNRGRSAVFCPYMMTWNKWSKWSIVVPPQNPINGLVIDALTISPGFRFRSIGGSIGIISRQSMIPRPDPMLLSLVAGCPPPFDDWSYLTTATLSGITQLHIRKVDDWYNGLCISHDDGFVETLGRWDPSDENAILLVYDTHRDGPLTALTFRYAAEDMYPTRMVDMYQSHIIDIVVGDLPEPRRTYVWRAADGQPCIAWWLTQTRDHITSWNGWRFPLRPAWSTGDAKELYTHAE